MPKYLTTAYFDKSHGVPKLDESNMMPSSLIGTGTPTNATFLRGDRTWAVPPGGGGNSILLEDAGVLLLE